MKIIKDDKPDIVVAPDSTYDDFLIKQIEKVYREEERLPDRKWHVYDATFPRKVVACRLLGCPLTPAEIGIFFLGKAIHSEMQRILGIKKAEVVGERWGIVGTMDWKGDRALEIKSSRKWTVPNYIESRYVRQAGYYYVIHKLDTIYVPIIYPTAGRTWDGKKSSTVAIKTWKIQFSKKAVREIEFDLKRSLNAITEAIKAKSVYGLPPTEIWMIERFGGVIPAYDKKEDLETMKFHPFWYAWTEHGAL